MSTVCKGFFFSICFVLVAVEQRVVKAPPKEAVSVVEAMTTEQREKKVEVVVEDTEVKQIVSEKQAVSLVPGVREIDDDWFVLLDVARREPSFVPPGILVSKTKTKFFFMSLWFKCLTHMCLFSIISCQG